MALIVLVGLPLLVGAVLVVAGSALGERLTRGLALATVLVALGVGAGASWTRPSFDVAWLPELGLRLHLALDGVSVPLVLLTVVVGVLVVVLARDSMPEGGSPATVLGCLLLVEGGALATFAARDAVLFFVAFEVVLIPMWVLITRFGDPHDLRARREAGHRFLLYTVIGSTLMLIGILVLVTSAGTSDFSELLSAGAELPRGRQLTIALLLTVGLAVKVPVFPLHTWLPSAHTIAPTVGSVLLAAILLKMGTYGLVRLPLASVPEGFAVIAPWLAIAGVVGIIWGALVCLVERDLKRLIAYSSVAHMGFVVLGIASGTEVGLQAALYGNLAHGVISALLFVVVGGLKSRWGSVDLGRVLPALREVAPHRGFFLILGLAAALGLPGLAGFWGEFFAIVAAWQPADLSDIAVLRTCAVVAAIGGLLAAAYSLRVANLLWVGDAVSDPFPTVHPVSSRPHSPVEWALDEEMEDPIPSSGAHSTDAGRGAGSGSRELATEVETRGSERLVLLVLSAGIFGLGLMPWWAMDVMAPSIQSLIGVRP